MLEQVETIFDNMREMMKKLKKASYKTNMEAFRVRHGHYFQEMAEIMAAAEDKEKAAREIAVCFCDAVQNRYEVKGKIKSTVQTDLNFFMIYYVFPSILQTESAEAKLLADTLCEQWGSRFKDSKIGYTDYDTLYQSFKEKIFGLF